MFISSFIQLRKEEIAVVRLYTNGTFARLWNLILLLAKKSSRFIRCEIKEKLFVNCRLNGGEREKKSSRKL
jgi:hypothetical protein